MLIRLISDIHIEFDNNRGILIPEMAEDLDTVLVVAGDAALGTDACDFLQQHSSRFLHVLYVLGNHEYYHNDMAYVANDVREELADFPNITLLDDDVEIIGGVRFVGATLWTDMDKGNPEIMFRIEQGMADYALIRNEGKRISAKTTLALHNKSKDFIENVLSTEHNGPTVVVTHHLPSLKSVHLMFARSTVNAGFCSNLEELIHEYSIDYWLHGHTHQTVEYDLFGTKVRMNPLGYYGLENPENKKFDPKWRIEV